EVLAGEGVDVLGVGQRRLLDRDLALLQELRRAGSGAWSRIGGELAVVDLAAFWPQEPEQEQPRGVRVRRLVRRGVARTGRAGVDLVGRHVAPGRALGH